LLASVSGFLGAGMGTVAGSNAVWINMVVGAIGAVVIVLLVNGFIGEE
jgi:hypothetical protein